jgi:hypothetical protein
MAAAHPQCIDVRDGVCERNRIHFSLDCNAYLSHVGPLPRTATVPRARRWCMRHGARIARAHVMGGSTLKLRSAVLNDANAHFAEG